MCYEVSIKSGKFCQLCNKELGYLDPIHKKFYRGNDPIKANNFLLLNPHKATGEYRKRCFDCYVKEFGRLPSRQNVNSEGLDWLLQIDTTSTRGDKAVTLQNMIKRHGEQEGTLRFRSYCDKQSVKNTFEFKKEKYGWTEEQFEEFNKNRAVTLELCIQRHGKDEGERMFSEYCEKQSYVGCALKYFQEKLGEEDGLSKYLEVNAAKAHTYENYIIRYGEEDGPNKWKEYVETVPSHFFSKMSSNLFTLVEQRLNDKSIDCRYNYTEFGIWDKEEHEHYKIDFCIPNRKKMIEFNGTYWHADPRVYSPDQVIRFKGGAQVVAEDIWIKDSKRIDCAKRLGYDILTVWEIDYNEDIEAVIEQCLKFLNT